MKNNEKKRLENKVEGLIFIKVKSTINLFLTEIGNLLPD